MWRKSFIGHPSASSFQGEDAEEVFQQPRLFSPVDIRWIIASMLKRTILCFLSITASACSFFPPVHKVPRSFSVHVTNDVGPVVDLKLRVTRFKNEESERLSHERRDSADPNAFEEIIAESFTDSTGIAHFDLKRSGEFTLVSDTPASQLDWVELQVSDGVTSTSVETKWPASAILRTSHLRGSLTAGLMSSHSTPLIGDVLRLRSLIEYKDRHSDNRRRGEI
jgi:hypothetical protein